MKVLNKQLKRIVNLINDKGLREKVTVIIEKPQIEIGGTVYSGLPVDCSPAGLSRHHSYPGGFIEHIVAVTEIALTLCEVSEKVYGGEVERDFVLAGILLHDIFKPLTYRLKGEEYVASDVGERFDHLTLITSELIRRGFPQDLIHIVCAHHGGQAGPMWPRTLEALICHLADHTDAQFNGEVLRAAKYLARRASGEELILHTSKEAFAIVRSKTTEGWKGVNATLEKIKREKGG